MSRILGLDLGTNSLGWAVLEKTSDTYELVDKGVKIFSEAINKSDKGVESSKASERTGYRSARKLKFRRKIRKYLTLKALITTEPGFCPLPLDELEDWKNSNFKDYPSNPEFLSWLQTDENTGENPYAFRDMFSRAKENWEKDPITAQKLGRAFYHLAQRRGFASNRKDVDGEDAIEEIKAQFEDILNDEAALENPILLIESLGEKVKKFEHHDDKKVKTFIGKTKKITQAKKANVGELQNSLRALLDDKENAGKVKKAIMELDQLINAAKCETLGQYFYHLYQKDRTLADNKIRTRYTDRENHYLHEFNLICEKQQLPDALITKLKKAIFYQRPLRSQKSLVGKCPFEPSKSRCVTTHPFYEEYRMWSFLNNLRVQSHGDSGLRTLNEDEVEKVLPKFYRVSKPTFPLSDLLDELFGKNNYGSFRDSADPEETNVVNYPPHTTVSGCPFTARLMSVFGRSWEERKSWKENLIDAWQNEGSVEDYEILTQYWQALYFADLTGDKKETIHKSRQDKLYEFVDKHTDLTDEQKDRFSRIPASRTDYAALSLNAIRNILPWLQAGYIYSHAVFLANLPYIADEDIWNNTKAREQLTDDIVSVIEDHEDDIRIHYAVNSLLRNFRKDEDKNAIPDTLSLEEEAEKHLANQFGKRHWKELPNREEILSFTVRLLKKSLSESTYKPAFVSVKRLEDKIKQVLLTGSFDDRPYCSVAKRIKKLYHPSAIEKFRPVELQERGEPVMRDGQPLLGLGNPVSSSLKNPVVMRSLTQLKKLVNHLLKEGVIDQTTRINIELARELNDANKRQAIQRYQMEREQLRDRFREKIRELYLKKTGMEINPNQDEVLRFQCWIEQDPVHEPPVTPKDIEKYQYWDEQNHICLYTGKHIGLTDFLGSSPSFDIEHTVPRSVCLDNSMKNKTLCQSKYNRDIKKNKLPFELDGYETILQRIQPWIDKVEGLHQRITQISKRTKGATDKAQKDKLIQERHYLSLHLEYWKGKVERFTAKEIPEGFKISQKIDIGIITRYAREYLGSLFRNKNNKPNITTVNGEMVAQFRKAWGLQDMFDDETGIWQYAPKNRSSHVHHCIDAITIAAISRDRYDQLAHAWKLDDEQQKQAARTILENSKPWHSFTQDMKTLHQDVLVKFDEDDPVPKSTKKILRQRGKRQKKYNKPDEFIYQQGDTARGRLHKDTYYGAIKQPERDEEGKFIFDENNNIQLRQKKKKDEITYVVRKAIGELTTDTEVDKIIDPHVREIVRKDLKEEKTLTKDLKELQKLISKTEPEEAGDLAVQEKEIEDKLKKLFHIPPAKGKSIYTPIRKVRIKAKLTQPLEHFKTHRDRSRYPHKRAYYVDNGGNYCLGIYEHPDNPQDRDLKLIRMIDAADYYKKSNQQSSGSEPLLDTTVDDKMLIGILRKGVSVLIYENEPSELLSLGQKYLVRRLYRVKKFGKDGRVTLQYHQEARNDKQIKDDYFNTFNTEAPKALLNGYSSINFNELPVPRFLISKANLNILVEGFGFNITESGKVLFSQDWEDIQV